MKKIWHTFKLITNLIRISKNPQNTKVGLAIAEDLLHLGLIKNEVRKIQSSAEGKLAIEVRQLLRFKDLETLQNCAKGTLGREYSDRMIRENLAPDFYRPIEIESDETYVMMRLRETHDLWHTITGFGTSVAQELGLQAFMMAQCHSPLPPVLIAGKLAISALKNPSEAIEILSEVSRGWNMGICAKPIFALEWEKHWDTPLKDLRIQYGIC